MSSNHDWAMSKAIDIIKACGNNPSIRAPEVVLEDLYKMLVKLQENQNK
jgi:hypothetical protein